MSVPLWIQPVYIDLIHGTHQRIIFTDEFYHLDQVGSVVYTTLGKPRNRVIYGYGNNIAIIIYRSIYHQGWWSSNKGFIDVSRKLIGDP